MPVRSRLRVHIQPRSRFRHIHRTAVERLTSARSLLNALALKRPHSALPSPEDNVPRRYSNESRLQLSENSQQSRTDDSRRSRWGDWLALDLRSLALMRIGLGAMCFFDAVTRLLYVRAHYTGLGILPLSSQLAPGSRAASLWSVSFLSDSLLWAVLCLSLYGIAGLGLASGYRSRLMGWLCWILAVSIQRRVPLLNDAGDAYLTALLFWSNFMPLEGAFSVQSAPDRDTYYSRLPGFCYIGQVAVLYWFSAVLRTGREWQVDFSALYYALQLPSMTTFAAPYLLALGSKVLSFFTAATLFLEGVGPVLLFLPSQRIRLFCVLLIVSFHLGIMASIRIPFFASLCIVGALGLLPARFWEYEPIRLLAGRAEGLFAALKLRRSISLSDPSQMRSRIGPLLNFAPAVFFMIVVGNLYAGIFSLSPETSLSFLSHNLSLSQRWGMFSPHASNFSGWETVVGLTNKGHEVDLLGDGKWPRRPWELASHPGFLQYRWRLYHQALSYGVKLPTDSYLHYLVKRWERLHQGESLVAAQYTYHPRVSAPYYLLGDEVSLVLATWHSRSFDDGAGEREGLVK